MAEEDRSHLGAGGLEPKVDYTQMPTYGALHRLRKEMHNIGDIQLPREVTLGQLLGFIGTFVLAFWVASWFFDGLVTLSVGLAVGIGGSRAVAITEDAGRAPLVEAAVFLWFWLFQPKYYAGAHPIPRFSPEERRMKAMLAAEHDLAGEETEGPWARFFAKMADTFRAIRRANGR